MSVCACFMFLEQIIKKKKKSRHWFYWCHCLVPLSRIALIKGEVLVLSTSSNTLYDIEHVVLVISGNVENFINLEIPI